MAGLLDWVDPTREWFKGRPEAVKGLLGAVYQMATDPQAREAAMSRAPQPFTDESAAKYQASAEGFWNPAGLLGTFAGVNAKTANKAMLEVAQKMDKAGADRGAIWNETGWFKGPDSKWRFEIDDSGAKLNRKTWNQSGPDKGYPPNATFVDSALTHNNLWGNYPEIADNAYLSRSFIDKKKTKSLSGSFNADTGEVVITAPSPKEMKSGLLHEMQHAIQSYEDFATGANPDALFSEFYKSAKQTNPYSSATQLSDTASKRAFEAYRKHAGEAEARAVQARMNMTPAERKAKEPWESYDIPWDQLIVRY